MSADKTNYIIVGGGCSGLSLAVHLLDAGITDKHITIIEPRESYYRDRTWCFWDAFPHRFSSIVSARWFNWKISTPTKEIVLESKKYAYQHLRSDDFYNMAVTLLQQHPNVNLMMNTKAISVHENPDSVMVSTDKGDIIGDYLFDGRLPSFDKNFMTARKDYIFQNFLAWHIKTQQSFFNPAEMTLMAFTKPQNDRALFFYLLPFSEREVLIEPTYFINSNNEIPEEHFESLILQYLNDHGIKNYTISYKEKSCYPMILLKVDPHPTPRTYLLGTAAGLNRPATGYAFLNIQRYSAELAALLVKQDFVTKPVVYSKEIYYTDPLFLTRLHQNPQAIPETMFKFYQNTPIEVIVRYMSDTLINGDFAKIVAGSK